MDWFDDWALTLAVFIPAVGMAIVLLIPRAQEELIKIVTLVTSLADARRRHRDPGPTSTSTAAGCSSP